MLILLTILVLAAAASVFIYFFNKDNSDRLLAASDHESLPQTTDLRPLFAPTDEELRAEAVAAEEQADAEEVAIELEIERKQRIEFRDQLRNWKAAPNSSEIGELFNIAVSDSESFALTAETVTNEFLNGRLNGISADDLAQMLESHFWLLSAEEREPGVTFRIKEAIRELRETGAKAPNV
jgi:hypothetical protein